MKKTLVSALTTALVVGAASTTFAAANPFEDVPADHWAYDAIAQLAADGVIEGYGDGTYRGDQEITRYEMAQMVARAMAKGNGVDKAMIDKLAAEFADELNSLGVRVSALEKKVDNVKWLGTMRYRYISERHDATNIGGDSTKANTQYVTFRLEPEMQINKNWTGHARIDYSTDMDRARNATNQQILEDGTDEVVVERMWVQGDYKNFQILLGKLPHFTNVDNGMVFDDNVSGGQITVGSNVKATLTIGRTNNLDGLNNQFFGGIGADGTASYQAIEIYNDRDQKFTWGVGYHHVMNRNYFDAVYGNGNDSKKAANIWDLGLGYKFSDLVALNGSYAWNSSADEDSWGGLGPRSTKHAWTIELDFKGADPEEAGSWGAFIAYRKLGGAAVVAPTYDAISGGQKGWEIGLDYVPMKNFQATVKYFRGKDMSPFNGISDLNASKIFTELNFFF
ncbi:MAG: S-layer homology domain-containing protein [Schwartzia sp.]|nr:S-layer homology domain-containing protein [Schwartzia sp. (in: firmicutes)]